MPQLTVKKAGEANENVVAVKDSKGRTLKLREPEFLEEFRLIEAVGKDLASNDTWMAVFGPLTYIVAIDDVQIPRTVSKVQAEALIAHAGREGYQAAVKAIKEHFGASQEDLDLAKN